MGLVVGHKKGTNFPWPLENWPRTSPQTQLTCLPLAPVAKVSYVTEVSPGLSLAVSLHTGHYL